MLMPPSVARHQIQELFEIKIILEKLGSPYKKKYGQVFCFCQTDSIYFMVPLLATFLKISQNFTYSIKTTT